MPKLIKQMTLVALFSTFITGTAAALVFGPSNLSMMGYPDHRCYAPSRPYSDDRYAWESFRADANNYIDCINEYVEAGNNDIRRIQDSQRDALTEADSFVSRIPR
ncbi:MAG TPA: hypothetical protein VEA80_02075 [Vitreimonas sp.]|uniref:hypothetical protein n=1 Tax=Vitreimonas sp. TaxID=3069702 RepID=UPI002D2CD342|nr:hypothetical protein [Vitreimonas sp.]HYD86238.1 hypothetical protein [Vitreimonas sp.]